MRCVPLIDGPDQRLLFGVGERRPRHEDLDVRLFAEVEQALHWSILTRRPDIPSLRPRLAKIRA